MKETLFDCEVTFEEHPLSRSTLNQLKSNFNAIEKYEDCHSHFDCKDAYGDIANVYLFQKAGKLYARGAKNSKVLRNPDNVYQFLNRSKRIKKITLVYKSSLY